MLSSNLINNVLSLSNAADKFKVAAETSAEITIEVYFLKWIWKFVKLGNRLQDLIPDRNFFKEHWKATKKVTFKDEAKVAPNKILSAQSKRSKSTSELIQDTVVVECNVKSLPKA